MNIYPRLSWARSWQRSRASPRERRRERSFLRSFYPWPSWLITIAKQTIFQSQRIKAQGRGGGKGRFQAIQIIISVHSITKMTIVIDCNHHNIFIVLIAMTTYLLYDHFFALIVEATIMISIFCDVIKIKTCHSSKFYQPFLHQFITAILFIFILSDIVSRS